ncbi:MAG: type II toxin-antitoxin system PemK/MazF family toxin [Patescibacteria group bacterium]
MEEYTKDFENWNKLKKDTDLKDVKNILIQEGAIWLMNVGVNIGFEIDGKGENFARPVIIVKKINNDTFFGIPASSKIFINYYRIKFKLFDEDRVMVLSQMRIFDKKRCIRFMMTLPYEQLLIVQDKIAKLFLKAETPQQLKAVEGNLRCPQEGDNK